MSKVPHHCGVPTVYCGVQQTLEEPLHLYNCRICRTTITGPAPKVQA